MIFFKKKITSFKTMYWQSVCLLLLAITLYPVEGSETNNSQPVTNHTPPSTTHTLFATNPSQAATKRIRSVTDHTLPSINYTLSVTNSTNAATKHSISVTDRTLPSSNYTLSATNSTKAATKHTRSVTSVIDRTPPSTNHTVSLTNPSQAATKHTRSVTGLTPPSTNDTLSATNSSQTPTKHTRSVTDHTFSPTENTSPATTESVTNHTQCVTNCTQHAVRLKFDPQVLSIEENYDGLFHISLSLMLDKNITFTLVQDKGGVVALPVENVTLQQTGNLTFQAVGRGRAVVSAQTPFHPYDYINVTDAFVVVNVFYSKFVNTFSDVVGWTYFVFWTVAFYPQIIKNYRRKSVVGLDFNYLSLNFLGHVSYDIFNTGLFFIPSVQAEYKRLHPQGVLPVRINDVGFSMHAVLATAINIFQCCIFERGTQTISYTCIGMLVAMISFLLISLVLAAVSIITWLEYLYYFSYIKLAITLVKHLPQIFYNYRRKSTHGFSIYMILFDFGGGTLSMLQMFLLAYNFDDWTSLFGDVSKFGLGLLSVAFDIVYIVQHYIVYRKPYSKKRESLIIPRTSSDGKRKPNSSSMLVRF